MVAVGVFRAAVAAGEAAGEVAGLDGSADALGDAVRLGTEVDQAARQRIGDQPAPAGVGGEAQGPREFRGDRAEALGLRAVLVVTDQGVRGDHDVDIDPVGAVGGQETRERVGSMRPWRS